MKISSIVLLITSLLITIFLFYIDEGNYHLEGILKVGNLIPLSVYFLGIYAVSYFSHKFLTKRTIPLVALSSSALFGGIAGTLLGVGFFLGWRMLVTAMY